MTTYSNAGGMTKFSIYKNTEDTTLYRLNMVENQNSYTVYVRCDSYKLLMAETNVFIDHFDKGITKYYPNTEANPHEISITYTDIDADVTKEIVTEMDYTEPPFTHGYMYYEKPVSWTNPKERVSGNKTVYSSSKGSNGCGKCNSSYDNECCTTRGTHSSMRRRDVAKCCHRQRSRQG